MDLLARKAPVLICALAGMAFSIQHFVPHPAAGALLGAGSRAVVLVTGFAMLLGVVSLVKHHGARLARRPAGWGYSAVTLAALATAFAVGLLEDGRASAWLYDYLLAPLQATLMASLGFYVASTALRLLKGRSLEGSLLLLSALLVILGRSAFGGPLAGPAAWLLDGPAMGARRGLLMGIALGAVAAALKLILGMDRPYLGRERKS